MHSQEFLPLSRILALLAIQEIEVGFYCVFFSASATIILESLKARHLSVIGIWEFMRYHTVFVL